MNMVITVSSNKAGALSIWRNSPTNEYSQEESNCPGDEVDSSFEMLFKFRSKKTSIRSLVARGRNNTNVPSFCTMTGLYGCQNVIHVFSAAECFFIILVILSWGLLGITTFVLLNNCYLLIAVWRVLNVLSLLLYFFYDKSLMWKVCTWD